MSHTKEEIFSEIESKLKELGEEKFYKKLLGDGVLKRSELPYPEIDMLNRAEDFFKASRNTGNKNYFIIGKLLRKAAHRLYRDGQRKIEDYPINKRFLMVVK